MFDDKPYVHPNNMLPFIEEFIMWKREKLSVFKRDYPTENGTGNVSGIIFLLVTWHLLALGKLQEMKQNYDVFNLCSGIGHSVYEVVKCTITLWIKNSISPMLKGGRYISKLITDSSKVNRE